ncbi:MAG: hypothetical protein JRJ62_16080, partial [Deltaproteobacteria bacterium]|nr:hypothetical protein [Deltaproteobacteria bacterium]
MTTQIIFMLYGAPNRQTEYFYRKKKLAAGVWSSVTDTIAPTNETSYALSIACDSYRNIHVVWQKEDNFNGSAVTKYRKFDAVTKE